MHKTIIIIFAVGLLGITALAGCTKNAPEPQGYGIQENARDIKTRQTITTGSTAMGDVHIALTPHKAEGGKLEVDIAANTHSISLSDFNLTKITTLEFKGKTMAPLESPHLSGHHASGTLVFDVGQNIEAYTITITGIPNVEQRVFTWRPLS